MNIAVIAANGRLGKIFVEEALRAGHHVRAGVRGAHDFQETDHLSVIQCDATREDELENLLKNQEVVVSCIGHVKGSPANVQTAATKAVINVMNTLEIKRFVDLTGTGVRFPGDRISLVDRVLNMSIGLIDPERIRDGREHQKVLQASNVDWTTIRVLKLQNNQPEPYELLLHGPTKWFVGRKEAAKAMLQVIEERSFVAQSPIIGRSSK